MRITKEKLGETAGTFLEVLDKEKAKSLRELEDLAGQAIPIEGKEQDYLIVEWRLSNLGTRALSVAYVIQHKKGEVGGGVPLDVRINPRLKYSQIILKCEEQIGRYKPFALDPFDNFIQHLLMQTTDWEKIAEEVAGLRR